MKRFVFLLLILLPSTLVIGADALIKAAPPSDSAMQTATASMEEAYHDEIAKANTPEERENLAWQMYKTAIDTTNDSAGRYVLLVKSRDEATLAANVDIAFAAIDEINKNYQIDVVKMQIDTLAACEKKMLQGADFPEAVEIANSLVDTAVSGDRYDLADQAIAIARMAANRSGYPTLIKYVAHHAEEVRTYADAYETIRPFDQTLAKTPADPVANYKVGRFRCFVKGDWTGILMLSLGSDASLKELAIKDMAGATTTEDQVKLGDAWWATAEKETGTVRDHVRWRAGHWYLAAYKKLAGLEQARVVARINQLVDDEEPRVVNLLRIVDPASDAVKGKWSLGDSLKVDAGRTSVLEFPYSPPDEYDVEVTFARNTGNEDVNIVLTESGHQFLFMMGAWGNTICAFEYIDHQEGIKSKTPVRADAWIVNGRKYDCIIKVRRNSASAYIDGKFVTQYRGDFSNLSNDRDWPSRNPNVVGLGTEMSDTTFYSARVVELSGRGSDLPDTTATKNQTYSQLSGGSGIIIQDDGLILTNRHVVHDSKTLVVLIGDQRIPAEIVAEDDEFDLALVRIKTDKKLSTLKLSPTDHPNAGADALVMGFPLLFDIGTDLKVTRGIVTAAEHKVENGADTMVDAKVNHGNSGGPILDKYGNVMAVVCLKTAGGGDDETYGVGISAGNVRKFLAKQKITLPAGDATTVLTSEDIAAKARSAVVCILGAE